MKVSSVGSGRVVSSRLRSSGDRDGSTGRGNVPQVRAAAEQGFHACIGQVDDPGQCSAERDRTAFEARAQLGQHEERGVGQPRTRWSWNRALTFIEGEIEANKPQLVAAGQRDTDKVIGLRHDHGPSVQVEQLRTHVTDTFPFAQRDQVTRRRAGELQAAQARHERAWAADSSSNQWLAATGEARG